MTDYNTVKGWAPMIREVILTKRMPPWHADPHYSQFKNDMSLSNQDASALIQWIDNFMPYGNGIDPLNQERIHSGGEWVLGEPDLVFTMKEKQTISKEGADEFRFIEADTEVENDIWVRAIDVLPGNKSVVHHCNLAMEFNKEELKDFAVISGKDMESGSVIAGYAPGSGPLTLDENTGIFIPKGAKLIFRVHYIKTGRDEVDKSKVGVYLHAQKTKYVHKVATATNREIKILPGDKNFKLNAEYEFEQDVLLTALQPHMHYRGKFMRYTAVYPDGTSEVLLSVPNYTFHWQKRYVLAEPKHIPAGTRMVVNGSYDNSKENSNNPDAGKTIVYGPYSDSEMFTAIMFYTSLAGQEQ